MIWTVYPLPVECGSCRVRITESDPVAVFAGGKLARCVHCAGPLGFEVDWAQVEQARFALEREAIAREREPVPVSPPTRRLPHVRPPVPLSAIAGRLFDPKAAAAGRDD